ncbi:acetolactate decarboxylase [Aquimarina sp. U1-2]|uniref:acetolactate decarboxylase n=1 Tax=Aquimarina sp. U1-2 TaxID=2823141 RepID=UPI001AEC9E85|nr:acetolactate decarboxylase [Aquimarina sp. U1-2]MBP2832161.1 acetolactate decarboxylase [Aquimarina sp. U1-2]
MKTSKTIAVLLIVLVAACDSQKQKNFEIENEYTDVKIVGAMKNVMWKGQLSSNVLLDTISNRVGLYGLGPNSYLTGELLINDGKSYVSKVSSDSTMIVHKTYEVSAPFFVYANVTQWIVVDIPSSVRNIEDLETFIDNKTKNFKRPLVFKLKGTVSKAIIHIQNLPEGTKVSSPKEAHQGQIRYTITNQNAEIVGFFSSKHKGIFTHHDTKLHMHLITSDKRKMGHLDILEINNMQLYLPEK